VHKHIPGMDLRIAHGRQTGESPHDNGAQPTLPAPMTGPESRFFDDLPVLVEEGLESTRGPASRPKRLPYSVSKFESTLAFSDEV
jgi:hypothetical protein